MLHDFRLHAELKRRFHGEHILLPSGLIGVVRNRIWYPDTGVWVDMLPGMALLPGGQAITSVTTDITSSRSVTVTAFNALRFKIWGAGGGGGAAGYYDAYDGGAGGASGIDTPTPFVANGGGFGEGSDNGASRGLGGTASGPVGATTATGSNGENGFQNSGSGYGGAGGAGALGGGAGGARRSASNGPGYSAQTPGGGGGGARVGNGYRAGGGGGGGGAVEYTYTSGGLALAAYYVTIGTGGLAGQGNEDGAAGKRGAAEMEVS